MRFELNINGAVEETAGGGNVGPAAFLEPLPTQPEALSKGSSPAQGRKRAEEVKVRSSTLKGIRNISQHSKYK